MQLHLQNVAYRASTHRRLESADAETPEWKQAYIDEQLAKQSYQEAFDAALRKHLLEPPRFDDATADDMAR